MNMLDALREAAKHAPDGRTFGARSLGKRRGRAVIFPVGLGSALEKAVREGYLEVANGGTRRRGRTYRFTPAGIARLDSGTRSDGTA